MSNRLPFRALVFDRLHSRYGRVVSLRKGDLVIIHWINPITWQPSGDWDLVQEWAVEHVQRRRLELSAVAALERDGTA